MLRLIAYLFNCPLAEKGFSVLANKVMMARSSGRAGVLPDLWPHLASASAVVVPLRLGRDTKIVEAMAMGKAIVSTTLGVEGIDALPGRDILVEDQPAAFAVAVLRLLAEPERAARLGQSARRLPINWCSWSEAARGLEGFYRRILEKAS